MTRLFTLRNALIVAAIALAAAFGYETDWGDAFTSQPLAMRQAAAKHDSAAVLPDFRLSSEANAYSQITERPLLNPSRKPAPTQAPVAAATEPPKPQIRRGLYNLVGVTDLGGVKVAQLREVATNRVKSVREGDRLQELKVASIGDARVQLTFMNETDVLDLAKFTASGRVPQPTIPAQPIAAPVALPEAGAVPATASPQPVQPKLSQPVAAPVPVVPPGTPMREAPATGGFFVSPSSDASRSLEERRRNRNLQ